jgi:hypothetical protein
MAGNPENKTTFDVNTPSLVLCLRALSGTMFRATHFLTNAWSFIYGWIDGWTQKSIAFPDVINLYEKWFGRQ